ncbi:nitrogen regulation protein NR(II) [Derxia gummosa]|uniref:Sensory histidine kinase/phosphatase NtrB n=1 Tax=Derxia gummosa DSM 723 TaxID=1121388 RepID=A0A8B6X658_9BURK|nr:nitrogen regulation protein NR(II) [Derxia gummosa]
MNAGQFPQFAGLDLLGCGVLVTDSQFTVVFANSALESMLSVSRRALVGQVIGMIFPGSGLTELLTQVYEGRFEQKRQDVTFGLPNRDPVTVHSTVVSLQEAGLGALIEFREIEQQLKVDRAERLIEQGQANRELIRNLAHEIKNPLGGIRGAAQLLEQEISVMDRAAELREYTQVIVKEADRLQTLVDRLLAPHRRPKLISQVNIHEVCERVRSVILAEFPQGLKIVRDYDISVPEIRGDKEQLIQAVLNIANNAAQALSRHIAEGAAVITLRTRVIRNVTLGKRRWPLALDLHIIDNGPGIPADIRDRIFYPLVSGREGGSGLGLTLAQTFVQQHHGVIECDSEPGSTDFRILLPLGS